MIKIKTFGIADALKSLVPEAMWNYSEEDYATIEWFSEDIEQPSKETVEQEILRLQSEYDLLEYQRLRAAEYPDFKDYLDGIVKNDQDQIQTYIDACLAVKEKYPKPSIES
jgi:hypothetical protein